MLAMPTGDWRVFVCGLVCVYCMCVKSIRYVHFKVQGVGFTIYIYMYIYGHVYINREHISEVYGVYLGSI